MSLLKRIDWLGLYICLVVPFVLVVVTGLIPGWGQWYCSEDWYRPQVEALAEGHLSLGGSLSQVEHDNTWSGGGVQQVWGLGVPLLRLPFELLARACGWDVFPNRLVIAFWIVCVTFWGYWVVVRRGGCEENQAANPLIHDSYFQRLSGLLLLLFFPSLIMLLSSRMMVFEEALTYTYLYGITEFFTLLWLLRKPQLKRWLLLCLLAGLGPLIRPTLLFYGIASLTVGAWVLWRRTHTGRGWNFLALRGVGRRPTSWLWGPVLFVLGGGLLFLTNLQRFDDGFEFGHKLNVQHGDLMFGSMYSTRFDCPWQDEPLISASKELFGMLFLPAKYNNANWYEKGLFPGQSETFRWRETYLRTYDLSLLALLLMGWSVGLYSLARHRRDAETVERNSPVPLIFWSLIATAPLLYFYLWTPVITSRYMLDFAPAFAGTLFALYQWGLQRIRQPRWANLLGFAFLGWVVVELVLSLMNANRTGMNWQSSVNRNAMLAFRHYTRPLNNESAFDGLGWEKESGETSSVVTVFVRDVEFLELELEPNNSLLESREEKGEANFPAPNPEVIRAKIGVEYLERESLTPTEHGWKIRFKGPRKKAYQSGYQVAFLAMIAKEDLGHMKSPWLLKSIRWNQTEPPKITHPPAG